LKINKAIVAEIAVSLLIVILLLYFAGAKEVAKIILNVRLDYLALSIIFLFCVNFGMAYRVKIILDYLKHPINYFTILSAHFAGMIASDFTPARSGYFTTAFALNRNHGVPLEKAMVSILGPQMFDFMLKVTTGTIAVWYLISFFLPKDSPMGLYIVLGVFVLAAMIALGLLILFSKRFAKLLGFIVLLPYGKHVHELITNMQDHSHALTALFPQLTLLLIFTWGCKTISWMFLAEAVGLSPQTQIPALVFFAFLQPLISMVEFVPTPTIAGMGLSESGTAAVLLLFSVAPSSAVAFALVNRFKMILVDSLGVREAVKALKLV